MTAAQEIDALIDRTGGWRGERLAAVRRCVLAADPDIVEAWKWMGSPVWEHTGILAVANPHKDKVKLTFMHGAQLNDPDGLFNAGLGGNARRAIDWFEGDPLDEAGLTRLIRAAIAFNQDRAAARAAKKAPPSRPV